MTLDQISLEENERLRDDYEYLPTSEEEEEILSCFQLDEEHELGRFRAAMDEEESLGDNYD